MSHVIQLRGIQKYVVELIEALVSTANLLRALALGCTKVRQGQVRLTCHRAERCDFIAPSPLPLLFPLLSATKPTNPISLFALLSLHFPYRCAKARTKSLSVRGMASTPHQSPGQVLLIFLLNLVLMFIQKDLYRATYKIKSW